MTRFVATLVTSVFMALPGPGFIAAQQLAYYQDPSGLMLCRIESARVLLVDQAYSVVLNLNNGQKMRLRGVTQEAALYSIPLVDTTDIAQLKLTLLKRIPVADYIQNQTSVLAYDPQIALLLLGSPKGTFFEGVLLQVDAEDPSLLRVSDAARENLSMRMHALLAHLITAKPALQQDKTLAMASEAPSPSKPISLSTQLIRQFPARGSGSLVSGLMAVNDPLIAKLYEEKPEDLVRAFAWVEAISAKGMMTLLLRDRDERLKCSFKKASRIVSLMATYRYGQVNRQSLQGFVGLPVSVLLKVRQDGQLELLELRYPPFNKSEP